MENNVKNLRLKAGMTQDDLAKIVGTSKPYISQLENGQRDIRNIRSDTRSRLCEALNCKPDDLLPPVSYEIDADGNLVIDGMYLDVAYPGYYIVEIRGRYFRLSADAEVQNVNKTIGNLLPIAAPRLKDSAYEADYFTYRALCCVPRGGYKFRSIGRAIEKEELAQLIQKYSLTEDDMTTEFETSRFGIFGPSYTKRYTCIQVRIPDGVDGVELEHALREKGIEAECFPVGRMDIRTK